MIIEQDKASPNLFVAKGRVFGHYIIAEGLSAIDAFNQYIIAATERLKRKEVDHGTR